MPAAKIAATIVSAAWIGPDDKDAIWAVPLAALVLLIPFFYASVWIEQRVMSSWLPSASTTETGTLPRSVFKANLLSYGFLAAFVLMWLIWGVLHR
jgi:hypothetical protein